MFDKLRDATERIRAWWERQARPAGAESKVLTSFKPAEPLELPRPLRQIVAIGAVASVLAFVGFALLCGSGLLLSLFAIYFLLTEVLGLELEIDPRLWQAL